MVKPKRFADFLLNEWIRLVDGSSVISVLMFVTKGFPEFLIRHGLLMLGTPMSIYAIPPISLENMVTDGTMPGPLCCYSFFTAKAFKVLFHVFYKLNTRFYGSYPVKRNYRLVQGFVRFLPDS